MLSADLDPRAATLMPLKRVLEPVVAPKHFAVDDERRRPKNAERLRLFGRLPVALGRGFALSQFDYARGVLADFSQNVGETGLQTRFVAPMEPAPVGRVNIIRAPALVFPHNRDPIGQIEFLER